MRRTRGVEAAPPTCLAGVVVGIRAASTVLSKRIDLRTVTSVIEIVNHGYAASGEGDARVPTRYAQAAGGQRNLTSGRRPAPDASRNATSRFSLSRVAVPEALAVSLAHRITGRGSLIEARIVTKRNVPRHEILR
jgi:hypothetical protein